MIEAGNDVNLMENEDDVQKFKKGCSPYESIVYFHIFFVNLSVLYVW